MLFLLLMSLLACNPDPSADPRNVTHMQTCYVVDYGEGVYYFPYMQEKFGNALASFLRQNPTLQVTGIASSAIDTNRGYFVTCRLKTVAESDLGPFPHLPSCEMATYPHPEQDGDLQLAPAERYPAGHPGAAAEVDVPAEAPKDEVSGSPTEPRI